MRMATTCPNLTKLNILPGSSRYPDKLRLSGICSTTRLFSPISQFRDLRFLYSSSAVLNADVLRLLGNLPRLESLVAHSLSASGKKDDEISTTDLILPEDSFPSLRKLKINCVPGGIVSKLWRSSPLARDLMSVRIQFILNDAESPSDLVCLICQGSPHIAGLELNLVETGSTNFSSVVVEHLGQLPLLRLQSIRT
ncbi:hypothetical protein BDV93DRAFT_216558 [Ceratobasidium sp. AG-I]|nr:hypothetical protein BDV93DRAFT_216558 [Ceratobasidium sp. AG-I]